MESALTREILFRGRRLDDGMFTCGDLSQHKDGRVAIRRWYRDTYRSDWVDPATVGQYAGRTDSRGNKIFEGDIVRITLPIGGGQQIVQVSEVYFDNGCFCVNWGGDFRPRPRTSIDSFIPTTIFEVIGNIHTSPELMAR